MTTPTTIVELRTSLLKVPWRGAAPAAGILSAPVRDIFVLEIETQGGFIGMSYLMPLRGGLDTLDACMKELIAPHVIGRDATEIEAIWQVLYRSNFWLGRMGVTVFAQSAVDMALWDIWANGPASLCFACGERRAPRCRPTVRAVSAGSAATA